MPHKPKAPHWSAALPPPSWAEGGKPHVVPASPGTVTAPPSTGLEFSPRHMAEPERWHVVDEAGEPHLVGGHPWVGSARSAAIEADLLTRQTGRRHVARLAAEKSTR